jgi:hypothetical protein
MIEELAETEGKSKTPIKCGMRPEPRGVQGSPALYVVQGGLKRHCGHFLLDMALRFSDIHLIFPKP